MYSAARFRLQESDSAPQVEVLDSGDDGERRLVDRGAAFRVLERLEVALGQNDLATSASSTPPVPAHVVEHSGYT